MKKYIYWLIAVMIMVTGFSACKKNFPDGGEYQEPTFLKIVGGTSHPKSSTRKFYTYYLDNGGYVWTVPPDAQVLSRQGTSTVEVKFGVQNGKIGVKAKGMEASIDITLQ